MRVRTGLATLTNGGPPARRGRRRAEMTWGEHMTAVAVVGLGAIGVGNQVE